MPTPESSLEDARSPWGTKGFIASAAVIGLVLVLLIVILVQGLGSSNQPDAGQTPLATTGTTTAAPAPGGCSLPDGDQAVPAAAPEATWTLDRKMVVPSAPSTFGPAVKKEGIAKCFAHNPTGALFAATHMLSVTWQDGPETLMNEYAVDSPEKTSALERVRATAAPLPTEVPQIKGYRIIMAGKDKATVQMAVSMQGALVRFPVGVVWTGTDWSIDAGALLASEGGQINDLTGYIPWAGI
jgi:hypothetical protein